MAQEDEPHLDPDAEYAAAFSAKHGLTPPIDVEEILREFADIDEDSIPHGCDGLLIRRPNSRPLVLVSRGQLETRRRFTLAHELGHLVLPWQIGTFLCDKIESASQRDKEEDDEDGSHEWTAYGLESSANTFASELLLPSRWLNDKFRSSGQTPLEKLFDAAEDANASILASLRAMCKVRCISARFLVTGPFDNIEQQYATKISRVQYVQSLSRLDEYERAGAMVERMPYARGKQIVCISYLPEAGYAQEAQRRYPGVHSTDILIAIIKDTRPGIGQAELQRLMQSANGVIGSANLPKVHLTVGELVTAFRIRFVDRPHLEGITSHIDFLPFLTRKGEEVLAKRKR